METKTKTKKPKDKGVRKGWSLIKEAKHKLLSETKTIEIYNPVTQKTIQTKW